MQDKFLKEMYKYDETDNSYHVVIDLDTYRDVYSEWDYSPFANRDIDDDLFEYMMECSHEIGLKRNMAIDFYIPENIVNPDKERKSILGFRHYFVYRIRKIKAERLRKLKKLAVLFIIGIAFLSIANTLNLLFDNIFAINILTEGLFIGAWVAVWEIFNTLFFSVNELVDKIKHYQRLNKMQIYYKVKI
jgi:hypothetical protein